MTRPADGQARSSGATEPRDDIDETLFAGTSDGERLGRQALLDHLTEAGADVELMRDAAREGRLATLPIAFALSEQSRYTLTEVAQRAKLEPAYLRSVLLSLGHSNPVPRATAFSDEDVELARILRRFLDAGLSRDALREVSRVVGQSVAQTAAVVREVAGNALIRPGDSEADLALRYAEAARELAPLLGEVLQYELRVHLREQATRDVITHSEREAGRLLATRSVATCFTDLSEFTRLGEGVPAERIGAIGSRMATFAAEVARRPVELVKTVGDGAMFVSADVDALLRAALALMQRVDDEGEDFPRLRAGIAFGESVNRAGDWFGPAVNRASRIVDLAKPGTVLAEEEVQVRAGPAFSWRQRRRRSGLRGVGRAKLYHLEYLATT